MHPRDGFRLGNWRVDPDGNRLEGPDGYVSLNARAMDALLYLAEHAGTVVSRRDFSETVWRDAVVTDDALTWCISELRRKLGDSAASPRYIETVPKRGYRLVAPIRPVDAIADAADPDEVGAGATDAASTSVARRWWVLLPIVALALALLLLASRDAPPPPGEPTAVGIAVLPLNTIAGAGELPLAEGLHQDLLTRLSEIPGLRVISATSMRRYRDTDLGIPEIAEALDVDWVVEGAVQQSGNRFRANIQLIEAARDAHRWARSYEDELTAERLFRTQSEIIEDIAGSIQTALAPQRRPVQLPTDSLEAYALTVRANTLLRQRSESAMRQAGELYERATRLDDRYAEAWAQRGDTLFLLHYYGYETDDRLLAEARQMAATALAIEPELGNALLVQGLVAMRLDHNLPAALELARRAWDSTPERAVGWLAWLEAVGGDLERALELTREQIRTTPFSPGVHMSLAMLTLCAGQSEEARILAERATELSPAYAAAWRLQGQALLLDGRYQPAITAFHEAMTLDGRETSLRDLAWLAFARLRNGESADVLVRDVMAGEDAVARALVNIAGEDPEAALTALGRTHWDDVSTLVVRYHPVFESLRERAAYRELIAQLDDWWGTGKAQ
jgi:DNA-binding winged helix-turn-helix (wHTH) protein/TolB-like protein/Flp pilus assembly protein TadD